MSVSPAQAEWATYQFTIEDEKTFADRIAGSSPVARTPAQMYEYTCHAGNSSLKVARAEDGDH